jgi:hypothetical protein
MSGKKIQKKTEVVSIYQRAIEGVVQCLAGETFTLGGKSVTSEAAIAIMQQHIDVVQASAAAHTAWLQAVVKERTTTKAISAPFLAALRIYVAARFGIQSDEYRAFGFVPPKPRIATPEAKVVGAAKLRATRKARHTMGSKQRLAIVGTVPSEIVLPVGGAAKATSEPGAE